MFLGRPVIRTRDTVKTKIARELRDALNTIATQHTWSHPLHLAHRLKNMVSDELNLEVEREAKLAHLLNDVVAALTVATPKTIMDLQHDLHQAGNHIVRLTYRIYGDGRRG